MENRIVSAVIFAPDGGEKRYPWRMGMRYVQIPPECDSIGAAAAISGTGRAGSVPGQSG
jgi:hypothetical protein